MKTTEIVKASLKTKIIKSFCFFFLLLFLTPAFSNNQKVEISCSEQDAQIFANGQLVGVWKATVVVKKMRQWLLQ